MSRQRSTTAEKAKPSPPVPVRDEDEIEDEPAALDPLRYVYDGVGNAAFGRMFAGERSGNDDVAATIDAFVKKLTKAAQDDARARAEARHRERTDPWDTSGGDPLAKPGSELVGFASSSFNELAVAQELQAAIDQTKFDFEHANRKVNFALVERALTGLSPSQLKSVRQIYKQWTDHDLDDDLLGGKIRSSLTDPQRVRVRALLEGTAVESADRMTAMLRAGEAPITWMNIGDVGSKEKPVPLTTEDAAIVVRRNRALADAAKLKLLLDESDKDREDARRNEIMALLRRSAAANDWVAAMFEREFGESLDHALADLGGLDADRARALRYGNWTRADALGIEATRQKIEKYERSLVFARGMSAMRPDIVKKARDRLQGEIEQIIATAGQGGGAGARDKIEAVLDVRIGDGPGRAVRDLLGDTLAHDKLRFLAAMATGDPVEEAAARLSRAADEDEIDLRRVAEAMRGLRHHAQLDVARELAGTEPEDKDLRRAIDERAHEYIDRLVRRFDEMGPRDAGPHKRLARIAASWDENEQRFIGRLLSGGGEVTPLEELELAMSRHPPDLAAATGVLQALPFAKRREVIKTYDTNAECSVSGVTLAQASAGKEVELLKGYKRRLPRTDVEAALAEIIEAPAPGGEPEIAHAYKWTRDTRERAIEEGGLTGAFADIGGREVREILDNTSVAFNDAHIEYRNARSPDEQLEALRKVRNARAAMSLNKDRYVAETDALRAEIAGKLAIAADIALTILLPASAGVIEQLAASLAANIGTKLAVLQDEYSLEMLADDLKGVGVSMGLGIPSAHLTEMAVLVLGRKMRAVEELGVALSPEIKALAKEPGEMSLEALRQTASPGVRVLARGAGEATGIIAPSLAIEGTGGFTLGSFFTNVAVLGTKHTITGIKRAAAASRAARARAAEIDESIGETPATSNAATELDLAEALAQYNEELAKGYEDLVVGERLRPLTDAELVEAYGPKEAEAIRNRGARGFYDRRTGVVFVAAADPLTMAGVTIHEVVHYLQDILRPSMRSQPFAREFEAHAVETGFLRFRLERGDSLTPDQTRLARRTPEEIVERLRNKYKTEPPPDFDMQDAWRKAIEDPGRMEVSETLPEAEDTEDVRPPMRLPEADVDLAAGNEEPTQRTFGDLRQMARAMGRMIDERRLSLEEVRRWRDEISDERLKVAEEMAAAQERHFEAAAKAAREEAGATHDQLMEKARRNQASAADWEAQVDLLTLMLRRLSAEDHRLAPRPTGPKSWQEAEDRLRRKFGGTKTKLPTFRGTGRDLGSREMDCFTEEDRISRDAKFGRQSPNRHIRKEIMKDKAMLASGAVSKVVWHFYENPDTGIGPTDSLRALLEEEPNPIEVKLER